MKIKITLLNGDTVTHKLKEPLGLFIIGWTEVGALEFNVTRRMRVCIPFHSVLKIEYATSKLAK